MNGTLMRVRITIVAMQKQKYYIFRVCVDSLSYPACHDKVGPCHNGVERPQVQEGGTASNMEGSWNI